MTATNNGCKKNETDSHPRDSVAGGSVGPRGWAMDATTAHHANKRSIFFSSSCHQNPSSINDDRLIIITPEQCYRDRARSQRAPAFPRSAYFLVSDEERLQHNFISFIDHSFMSSYSQVNRLIEPRNYARSDQFQANMTAVPPTIDDVAPPPSLYGPVATALAWNGLPARAVVGAMSYWAFPFIIRFLENATQDVDSKSLEILVNAFLPGVSIVLGTYFSLTISILYERFAKLQETVSGEASLLSLTCQNLLHLFASDPKASVEAAQCVADQIRILAVDNRGRETMGVIYNDPYARILQVLQEHGGTDNKIWIE